jgi:hypothetical protein
VAEKELPKSNWSSYFEEFAKRMLFQQPERARVEGVAYDNRAEILEISVGNFKHLIRQPKSIFVDEAVGMLTRFKIIDADNLWHIVQLHKPQRLRNSPAFPNKIDEAEAEFCPASVPPH